MSTIAVSISLDQAVHAGMVRRAKALGKKPTDYIRQLLDAAYAARVGIEKNLPATDKEMDEAVRAVCCLAGEFSVPAIAKQTGLPTEFVERILAGLNIAARQLVMSAVSVEQKPAPVQDKTERSKEALISPPEKKRPPYSPEEVERMKTLYANGHKPPEIAAVLGRSAASVATYISAHRSQFPYQTGGV